MSSVGSGDRDERWKKEREGYLDTIRKMQQTIQAQVTEKEKQDMNDEFFAEYESPPPVKTEYNDLSLDEVVELMKVVSKLIK